MLQIDDAGFQDFRADASCLIRPQSLLGEKFVECEPTQPRAAGSEPPPPLEQIPEGEPGEGQYLLPLENNGKAVDLDLVNNIMREPYAERFRLILNDLGAGLAARGEELAEIVERCEPGAARDRRGPGDPRATRTAPSPSSPRDGDAVLEPLARERERIAGFIRSAADDRRRRRPSAAPTSSASFAQLPPTLREVRLTMGELRALRGRRRADLHRRSARRRRRLTAGDAGAGPVRRRRATTALHHARRRRARPSQALLVASDPVIRQICAARASAARPATSDLAQLLRTLEGAAASRSCCSSSTARRRLQRLRQVRPLPAHDFL